MTLNLTSFQNALRRLDEALELCNSDEAKGSARLKEAFRGNAILAFEYNYGLCIKMLRLWLLEYGADPSDADYMDYNNLIRRAYEIGLVSGELSIWMKFRDYRNISSHAYDEKKAAEVYQGIPAFREEARFLLNELQRRQDV